MIVVCDGEDRENEGDLVLAAQFATPEAINFMAKEARGLICLAMTPERCEELGLNLMAAKNEAPLQTAFTVSIEAAEGVTTGISAADRARTIQVAIDPHSTPADLHQPGHVFPLKAKEGGVLERTGHTEASVDIARLAGLIPAGVICEIMNDDGTMARVPDLVGYCERHELKMVTVADLISYRRRTEKLVERIVATKLPTKYGEFTAVGYRSLVDDKHHVAMVKGDVAGTDDVLVRVHSECLTGDVFHSLRCDCGDQLEAALAPLPAGPSPYPFRNAPPPAHARKRVGAPLDLGVRALNTFLTCCRGQRMGVFAGSGVGKSVLLSMLARDVAADVSVIGVVGERGREVQEFLQDDLGAAGLARSVVVVSTSDEPALMRRQVAYLTLAIAEYFRDEHKDVLVLMDLVTRFAMAEREIGLSAGEPPTAKGYTPTVLTELPRLLERAGPGTNAGTITGIFTVLSTAMTTMSRWRTRCVPSSTAIS